MLKYLRPAVVNASPASNAVRAAIIGWFHVETFTRAVRRASAAVDFFRRYVARRLTAHLECNVVYVLHRWCGGVHSFVADAEYSFRRFFHLFNAVNKYQYVSKPL